MIVLQDDTANMIKEEFQNAQIEYCSCTPLPRPPLYLWLSTPTGKHQVSSLPDTGASKMLINEYARKCGLSIFPLAPIILRQAGGSALPVSGYTKFDATLQDVCSLIKAIVVTNLHKNLLISRQDLIALQVIYKKNPAQLSKQACSVTQDNFDFLKANIIARYQETLSDDLNPDLMEMTGNAMHIYLQPNAVPSQISITRLVPLRMQHAASQVIADLLKKQVIT